MRRLHFADERCVPCGGDPNFSDTPRTDAQGAVDQRLRLGSMRKEEIVGNLDDFDAGG
jgi:hypothetical protein